MATLDILPVDAWTASVAGCLTGWELLELARASRWTWSCFSQGRFWHNRVSRGGAADANISANANDPHPLLSAYQCAFSLRFQGCAADPRVNATRSQGPCAQLNLFRENFLVPLRSFSFDLWFSLFDGTGPEGDTTAGIFAGGILLGGQSSPLNDVQWPHYHQQFVAVSSDRKLYCSVLNARPEIATNLQCNRWYHLALTYDERQRLQCVFLDGHLVNSLEGRLHSQWWYMRHVQVGTGYATESERNFPKPTSCGWYAFHGLLDAFRMWTKELSTEEISQLARNDTTSRTDDLLWYSLKRDKSFAPLQRVPCSRPQERIAQVWGDGGNTSSTNSQAQIAPIDIKIDASTQRLEVHHDSLAHRFQEELRRVCPELSKREL
uniref:LamG-like jellyroll fold domain-containing protein n=1 Tax=Globisporangium ultimum (strain ATCC 200006 / CBS 805.95 / DAOM BR144) TaxID=431595 RepID=K3WWB0_GLOUD